jgi:hypothetical protein
VREIHLRLSSDKSAISEENGTLDGTFGIRSIALSRGTALSGPYVSVADDPWIAILMTAIPCDYSQII